ncbi:class I SAM-dependent methyltransferase [Streptomyces sp. NBC_01257]|uniref:class I SAM-dependent methyltransferase n=1 Tax=Streptomyces sp. NBC_01257 TaxID=2903799 RepID=UPI002DDB9D91|nr:class I SAM-dependent methyltransferase [Streptomyces sp. NBC_01257]WRZ68300.1 class I SAM-dependent methyltransferase [Streptomyces sp. NBC_01257]
MVTEDGPHETDDSGARPERPDDTYDVCFEQGHRFRLFHRDETFHVSRAGLELGNHLVRNLTPGELSGRILELGTGSGAIALLLRSLGATSVTATDICASAVTTARQNELRNFGDSVIDFWHGDLFAGPETGREQLFDLIVFNPPGWRAPSDVLKAQLGERRSSLNLEAMFYGDSVLLRFLQQLPQHLAENGRAVLGLNSLLGIADIFDSSRSTHRPPGGLALHSQLLERVEFPLLFYTDEWLEMRHSLLDQFEQGRRDYAATYRAKGETIHWFYEITEVTVKALAPLPLEPQDLETPPMEPQPLEPSQLA